MSPVPTLISLATRAVRRLGAAIQTAQARGNAVLGEKARVLAEGEIINLSSIRDRISIGSFAGIRGEILVFRNAGNVRIGDWFYLGPRSTIWSGDEIGISIGHRVLISSDVMIHDTNSHSLDAGTRAMQTKNILLRGHPETLDDIRTAPVEIGDDVWIGAHAMISKGVRIGARAVIGAHAVVLSDVPEDAVIHAGMTYRKEAK